jgi:hypothetical protein
MRKIKNFKVNLRIKEILRVIKKLNNISDVSLELEEIVKRGYRVYSKFLHPAVVYDTFSKESFPLLEKHAMLSKYVAFSVFFITIGNDIEEEYKLNATAFGEHTSILVFAIAVDALEQARNFVQRLIMNEAKDESCEISRAEELDNTVYGKFARIIPIEKINVKILSGELDPKYSTCGLLYWIPSKKNT